jgi:hypothetical protein
MAVPARCAQLGKYLGGVVAALAGDDDLTALERVDIELVELAGIEPASASLLRADLHV